MPVVALLGLKSEVTDGAAADDPVTVVFLVITCSPSIRPLMISVKVPVSSPMVTGTRRRVVAEFPVVGV